MSACGSIVLYMYMNSELVSVPQTCFCEKSECANQRCFVVMTTCDISKFYLIMQFFIPSTPKIFRGDQPIEKVKEFISTNLQVADCYCDRDFMLTSCPGGIFQWFSLNIVLNLIGGKIQIYICDRVVSKGKLGVQTSVNLSIFISRNHACLRNHTNHNDARPILFQLKFLLPFSLFLFV